MNDFALDYLNKHPLQPDPWDEPDPCCANCGWGNRETDRCALCRCEEGRPAVVARVWMPVLDELMWRRVNAETLGGDRSRAALPRTAAGVGPREPALPDTLPAPPSSSPMAVAVPVARTLDVLGLYAAVMIVGGLGMVL